MSFDLTPVMQTESLKITMISGSTKLSRDLFDKYYKPEILKRKGTRAWVVGNAEGVDTFAQELLHEMGEKNVTVYDVGTENRQLFPNEFKLRNGFAKFPLRDIEMSKNSDEDIAFLLPDQGMSGTAANLIRRILYRGFLTVPELRKYDDTAYSIIDHLRKFQMTT